MKKQACNLFILIMGFHVHGMCEIHESTKVHRAKKILSRIDSVSKDYMDLLKVPGCAVGVIVDDEVVYSKAFGMRNVAEELPVTTSTLFPIGSATKSFTTFLTGQLVDQGLLHWDDPVVEHIPEFRLMDPFTTYEITLRDFLTHVSGYSRHDVTWFGTNMPRNELLKRMRHLEPVSAFREQFNYGNLGYMVVGCAAERILGQTWEELLNEFILNPLDMHDTTADLGVLQASDNHSLGYRDSELGVSRTPFVDVFTIGPAGSLNSNVDDMNKWVKAILKKGDGLIQSETFDEIIKPQVVSNVLLNNHYGIEDLVMMETYGLGWFVVSYRHHEAVLHGGNIEGFSSCVIFFPKENIGIVVLSNKNYTPLPYMISCEVADLLLGITPVDWKDRMKDFKDYNQEFYFRDSDAKKAGQVEGTSPSHHMRDFTGVYENPGYGQIEFSLKEDRLFGTYNTIPLYFDHWHYDTFEISKDTNLPDILGLKVSFRHNFFGEIDEVVVPFEPYVKDLVFKKKKDENLFKEDYLDKFIGIYNYLGFNFTIKRENNALLVSATGQAPYVLVPEKDGLFTVENMEGYTILFLVDEDDEISAIQLIQPNNVTYTAYKNKECE